MEAEAEAVEKLWLRSEDKHKLRYTMYLGDGDSKWFSRVCAANPYKDINLSVQKGECIGHVQKHVGKGMRDLKTKLGSTKLDDGKPLTGKGRLTEKVMDKLQNYYGIAVRKHVGNVEETYRAIWASLHHTGGSHDLCPTCENSWCKAKQGAGGQYTQSNALPKAIVSELKPLYLQTETCCLGVPVEPLRMQMSVIMAFFGVFVPRPHFVALLQLKRLSAWLYVCSTMAGTRSRRFCKL